MKKPIALFLVCACILFSTLAVEAKCRAKKEIKKADLLYFDKKFDEALHSYLAAYERGCQEGITLYKIAYCYMKTGDSEKEKEFLNAATALLLDETSQTPSLENLFYLANCYLNLAKKEEAIETSKKTMELYENGTLGKLKDATSLFRIGKVYFDAGNLEKGIEHYRKAYQLSKKEKFFPVEYMKMILQRLAPYDYKAKHFEGALEEFSGLVEIDPRYDDAYFYLAITAMNLEQYEKAETAWKKVIELGLPNSAEAQYNHRIARAAFEESPLPAAHESEKKFKEMTDEELEAVIVEISQKGMSLKQEASENGNDLQAIVDSLKKTKKLFTAACSEYIARGLLIRESAITKGFAVQVMKKDPWEIQEEESH